MARPKILPKDQSRPFDLHELFFSTTDRAGVIRSGNEVFLRVSAYEGMDALIGQPHNIIRHPDMPRAVFKLFWDHISHGKPICAYVKNLAKDGCYYWVVALVVPTDTGYLSIRFKPSSPLLDVVIPLYREMLAVEAGAGDAPEDRRTGMAQSGVLLDRRLKELGFRSYDEFMHTFMMTEFASRRTALNGKPTNGGSRSNKRRAGDPDESIERALHACLSIERHFDDRFARVSSILDLIDQMNSEASFLRDLSSSVNTISMNAVIVAHRLASAGRGLAVITGDLASVSEKGTRLVTAMNERIMALVNMLRETAFTINSAKLQVEMAIFFAREILSGSPFANHGAMAASTLVDLGMLVESMSASLARLTAALPPARELVATLGAQNEELSETLRTLSSVQVLGRVEAAQLTHQDQFGVLFEQIREQLDSAQTQMRVLRGLQDEASDHVANIVSFSDGIQSALAAFQTSFRQAA